ncbi:MAG: TetR/AcrR family transcriptional regulator [Actinomycetota bacterium]|nr:MAG: TetR/AcrR family transcriptional regulator [Actinomycetota bacterium]
MARPRSVAADRAITQAVMDIIDERGLAELSVDAVAARACVGKATIYRRFPTKTDLVSAVIDGLKPAPPPPRGDVPLRDYLLQFLGELARHKQSPCAADDLWPMMLTHSRDPEVFQLYFERVVRPRRAALRQVLEDAVAQGELRDDVEFDVMIQLLVGPILHQAGLRRSGVDVAPEATVEEYLDVILRGLRPDQAPRTAAAVATDVAGTEAPVRASGS